MEEQSDFILEYIDNLEKTSSKEILLRNPIKSPEKNICDTVKLLANLFKKSKKSIKEKIDIVLEYNDDFNMDTLLKKLNITFLQFNSIISKNADNELIYRVDKILSDIIADMTAFADDNDVNMKEQLYLRNSNLDSEAKEFADKLFNKLYGKNK